MQKKYFETISEKTLQEIKLFLQENPSQILDYSQWRTALELHKKAFYEIYACGVDFRKEFDEIIQSYQEKARGVLDCNELLLINQTNKQMADLYDKYVNNIELHNLMNELISKTYK